MRQPLRKNTRRQSEHSYPERGAAAPSPERIEPSPVDADLGAAIAEHAIQLAHLYLERFQILCSQHDKARADDLYQWATKAAEAANEAGRDRLLPELTQLESDLNSCALSQAASHV
jgi:hypothetical protein